MENANVINAPGKSGVNPRTVRTSIMIGLILGMLLACIDGTVVGTSMPHITADFPNGNALYTWLITGYLLAETIVTPIAGKMSDLYGRKPIFLAGMILFLGGSIFAGFSQSMEWLIIARVVQGLGGGMLIPVAMATVADLYEPQERGKIQGILGAIFAIASAIGPFIGGVIVDHATWHWVFFVNVPVGILAIAFTAIKFPKVQADSNLKIDYPGIATLSAFLALLVMIVTFGGSTYAWASVEIIGMVLAAIIFLGLFIYLETRSEEPLVPLRLFRSRTFVAGCSGLLIMSLGLFGILTYVAMYLQVYVGFSATNSGATLIPLTIGMTITSIGSGFLLKKTGYMPWLIIGPPISAIGLYLISTLGMGSPQSEASLYLIIAGLGMGCVMSNFIVAAQNITARRDMGVMTSTMSLFRSIGGTVGAALIGSLINNRMITELQSHLPSDVFNAPFVPHDTGIMDEINNIVAAFPQYTGLDLGIIMSYGESLSYAFVICSIIVLATLIASLLVKRIPLKTDEEYEQINLEAERLHEEELAKRMEKKLQKSEKHKGNGSG
ncbi:MDR family MFS transporter [Candidatus Methanomassiliicoccus intestinalis]|uniref:MDR family MFS transporter n=1 Tax=Candidatus Methanomassiliicoccus intestinalis TaxID=1406512 RepID=UPI0037DC882D